MPQNLFLSQFYVTRFLIAESCKRKFPRLIYLRYRVVFYNFLKFTEIEVLVVLESIVWSLMPVINRMIKLTRSRGGRSADR